MKRSKKQTRKPGQGRPIQAKGASRPKKIDSDGHRDGVLEYVVCQHLRQEQGLTYYTLPPWPGHPFTQAWCQKCHAVLEEEDGWSDRAKAFSDLRLVCSACYQVVVSHHHWAELPEG
jgi:hypothetical protein